MSNREKHWKKTKGQMIVTMLLWFFFGYVIFMFGESINLVSFLGYPLAYYMSAQGSLLAFVIILFWSAKLLALLVKGPKMESPNHAVSRI